jgi:beta-glucosidase
VTVDVTNSGDRPGDEVVDAFVTEQPPSLVLQPLRWHVGFDRVDLAPGETETVTLQVPVSLLARTQGDVSASGPREVVPGEYTLAVGGETTTFTVTD